MSGMTDQLELQFPEVFQSWHILREIGRGSYGEVFEVQRESMGMVEIAAMKHVSYPRDQYDMQRICANLGTTDDSVIRENINETVREYRREYEMMRKFSGQSNIVSCEDFQAFEKKDMPGFDIFIRMEKLTAVSDLMMAGKFDREETIRLGMDICSALELLEGEGVIHRDIKPENMFVNDLGNYKLGDFGAARTLNKNGEAMSVKGTPAYMAPEIALQKPSGPWTDIYSLGLVLYRLMNRNQPPFLEENSTASTVKREQASSRRLVGEKLPPPANADPALAAVILKACAHDPKERYQNAAEFKKALMSVSKGSGKAKNRQDRTMEQSLQKGSSFRKYMPTDEELAELEKQRKAKEEKERELAEAEARKKKEEQKKKQKKTLLIVAACVAAVAVLAVVGILVKQNADWKAKFEAAVKLLQQENADLADYETAEKEFTELGTYTGAAEKADEARKAQKLKKGRDALEAGDPESLSKAKGILEAEELKGFRDTDSLLSTTLHKIDVHDQLTAAEAQVAEAERQRAKGSVENLEAAGEAYENARRIYDGLKGDKEAPGAAEKAQTCANWKTYVEAEIDLASGTNKGFKDARFKFSELAEKYAFEDAAERVKDVDEAEALDKAEKAFALGSYEDALKYFSDEKLKDNTFAQQEKKLVENILAYDDADSLLADGNYKDAAEAYTALELFVYETREKKMDAAKAAQYALGMDAFVTDKDYPEAERIFTELDNWSDAKEKAEQVRIAARLREGVTALEEGNLPGAREIFEDEILASSVEAQKYLAETKEKIRSNAQLDRAENEVEQAGKLRDKGLEYKGKSVDTFVKYLEQAKTAYDNARIIYAGLDDISGTAEEAERCRKWTVYIQAEIDLARNQFTDARIKFGELVDADAEVYFADAADRLAEVNKAETLHKAAEAFEKEDYESALNQYSLYPEDPQAAAGIAEAQKYLDYNAAEKLLENGEYEAAADAYAALIPFKDTEKARNYALGLKALFTDLDYAAAQQIFAGLKGYRDSAGMGGIAATQKNNQDTYNKAVDAFNVQDYAAAKSLFESVKDFYGDAAGYIAECDRHLKYQQAKEYYGNGNYGAAAELMKDLHLDDSDELAAEYEFLDFSSSVSNMTNPGKILLGCYRYIYSQEMTLDARKNWARQIMPQDKNGASIAKGFAEAPLFTDKQMSDEERAGILCDALLADADPDGAVRQKCMNCISAGMTTQAVLNTIVNSGAYYSLCSGDGWPQGEIEITENRDRDYGITRFVQDCYLYCLRRGADPGGLNLFTGQILNDNVTLESVMSQIAVSAEAMDNYPSDVDYVRMLYQFMLGRDATEADVELQVGELQKGVERSEMVRRIVESFECAAHLDNTYMVKSARSQAGKYNQASRAFDERHYEEAMALFQSIADYRDSAARVEDCKMEIFCRDLAGGEVVNGRVHRCYETISRFTLVDDAAKAEWGAAISKSNDAGEIIRSYMAYPAFDSYMLSNEDRVSAIWYIMLGQRPSVEDAEYQRFISALEVGMSCRYEVHVLSTKPEYQAVCAADGVGSIEIVADEMRDNNYALSYLVATGYRIVLQRPCSADEINYWCGKYFSGTETGGSFMRKILINQEAEQAIPAIKDYIYAAYRFALGREPSIDEVNYWAAGRSRVELVDALITSDECAVYLGNLGLK